eukprot:gene34939-41089_t
MLTGAVTPAAVAILVQNAMLKVNVHSRMNVPLSDVSAAESTYNDLTASLTDPSVSSTLSSNLVALATAVGQSDVFPSSVTVADAIIPTFDPSF